MCPESLLTHQSILSHTGSTSFLSRFDGLPEGARVKILRFGAPLGSQIETFNHLPRCMTRLKELIKEAEQAGSSLPSGTVVCADELSGSSGRFDRLWHAPPGGAWLALAWADTLLPEYSRLLPLAAGTACGQALRHFGVPARVKWVNDILVNGCKIGGILSETFMGSRQQERYHIIGIGINCNNGEFPGELQDTAISMQDFLGSKVDVGRFMVELLACLAWNFGLVHYQEARDLAEPGDGSGSPQDSMVVEAWQEVSDTVGRKVVYGYDVVKKPLYEATVVAVDGTGALVLELAGGQRVVEHSGEIIYLD